MKGFDIAFVIGTFSIGVIWTGVYWWLSSFWIVDGIYFDTDGVNMSKNESTLLVKLFNDKETFSYRWA